MTLHAIGLHRREASSAVISRTARRNRGKINRKEGKWMARLLSFRAARLCENSFGALRPGSGRNGQVLEFKWRLSRSKWALSNH